MPNERSPLEKKQRSPLEDADDFWELDALLPPRASAPPRMSDIEAVEVSLGEKSPKNEKNTVYNGKYPPITASPISGKEKIDFSAWLKFKEDRKNTSSSPVRDDILEYVPDNPLIFRVRIQRRRTFDGIDERSLSDMRKLSSETAEFTKNVEFTAFFPQYSRMTEEQKRCYIGFRTQVMNGNYPEVSESYILFLLYEIINLPDRFPPSEGIDLVCTLMNEYRGCSDGLFSYMCDWLADLCLINRLPIPFERLEAIREKVYKRATWKEMYVPFRADVSEPDACVLLSTASAYDYRTSKYYTAETSEYFESHIPKAIGAALRTFSATEQASDSERDITTLSHDAFRGAFRSAKSRYNVAIDCACFTRSPLLRQTVTALVKYAENFVREMIGIRARLSVSFLATEKKEAVKAYFDPLIKREESRPPLKRGRKKKLPEAPVPTPVPEYEKYYEPQSSAFSPELAARIEADSWRTTELLISAFGGEEITADTPEETDKIAFDAVNPQEEPHLPPQPSIDNANLKNISQAKPSTSAQVPKIEGLNMLLRGNFREFNRIARENGLLPDTLAENINQWAIEVYGDIAVDYNGVEFSVLEDYRSELEEMLSAYSDR